MTFLLIIMLSALVSIAHDDSLLVKCPYFTERRLFEAEGKSDQTSLIAQARLTVCVSNQGRLMQ